MKLFILLVFSLAIVSSANAHSIEISAFAMKMHNLSSAHAFKAQLKLACMRKTAPWNCGADKVVELQPTVDGLTLPATTYEVENPADQEFVRLSLRIFADDRMAQFSHDQNTANDWRGAAWASLGDYQSKLKDITVLEINAPEVNLTIDNEAVDQWFKEHAEFEPFVFATYVIWPEISSTEEYPMYINGLEGHVFSSSEKLPSSELLSFLGKPTSSSTMRVDTYMFQPNRGYVYQVEDVRVPLSRDIPAKFLKLNISLKK